MSIQCHVRVVNIEQTAAANNLNQLNHVQGQHLWHNMCRPYQLWLAINFDVSNNSTATHQWYWLLVITG